MIKAGPMKLLVTLLILSTHSNQVYSQVNEFTAKYALYWGGLKVGNTEQAIKKTASDLYTISAQASPLFSSLPLGYAESSDIELKTGQIYSQQYQFKLQEGSKNKAGELKFDWAGKKLHIDLNGIKSTRPLNTLLYDNLSFILQLQLDLKAGKTQLDYPVYDKGKLKHYHLDILGNEWLDCPLGRIQTVKLRHIKTDQSRETLFWLAPEYNYLLVKFTQARKNRPESSGLIQSLTR